MNKIIHGFELINEQPLPELNGIGYEYVHTKTKAHLVFLKTDDQNKAFAIGFKTIPSDSTGVAHINEHSVLCGSDKFTTKEPFVDLLKGSLNTFLNAMTYPDKTIYPFSTQNDEDYKNILNIYVDAVFNPKMKTIKEVFLQEGWHYELASLDAPLILNGVVYNEMKGAYSSPEEILDTKISAAIFDNCYQYSSGGDPDVIPSLTYEDFIAFHDTYYHPSNSCIYLYGDVDAPTIMEILDNDYLSKFDYQAPKSKIGLTSPFNQEKIVHGTYSIGEEDDPEGKTYAQLTYVIEDAIDNKLATVFNVLADVFFNADSACIKNKLLDEGLCQDLECYLDNHKLQPTFNIIVQNTTPANAEKIFDMIESSLNDIVKNGLDEALVEGCILNNEFALKEYYTINAGRGINIAPSIFARYFYGRNPFEELAINDAYTYAKELLSEHQFEKLIKKYLVDNQFRAKVILEPECGLASKKAQALTEQLAEYKASLTPQQIEQIMEEERRLKLRQSTPDSLSDKQTIPNLKLSDISKTAMPLDLTETKYNHYTLYHYAAETNGIAYGRILTDASVLTKEELPYLGFITNALSMLATANHSVLSLPTAIMQNIGRLSFNATALSDTKDLKKTYKYFEVNFKAMEDKLPQAIELIDEILFTTDFTSKERLKQILNIVISRMESEMISDGHIFGMFRVTSKYNEAKAFMEDTHFYAYYEFVKNVAKNFDNEADNFIAKLQLVLNKVLNNNHTMVSFAGNDALKEVFVKAMTPLCNKFKAVPQVVSHFASNHINEGIMTTANGQYVSMGYCFKEPKIKYTGHMDVLKTIMSTDYAWNNIRVLGGAYGIGFRVNYEGMVFASYRDPHLKNSLKVYREAGAYFKNLKLDETELNNYIIGTIATMDMPRTAEQKAILALNNLIAHVSEDDRNQRRQQVLTTKLADINALGDVLTTVFNDAVYVVFGNENKVKENSELFDEIKSAK